MPSSKFTFPARAYSYKPATGVTSQMPMPVYNAVSSRLQEEQKQRDLGREKIMLPDGKSFYYKDTPGVTYPGTSPTESAYDAKVNANPQFYNPVKPPTTTPTLGATTYFRGMPESLLAKPPAIQQGSPQAPTTPSPAATPAATAPTIPTAPSYNFSPPTNPADALSGVSNNNSPMQQQNTSYTSPAGGTRKKQFANKWFGKQQFL